jgi:plastocyanin
MSEQTATLTQVTSRERGGNMMFPALLIALGGLFLLGNFGLIAPISMRSVLSLWPLVPIGIGIQLVLGRDRPSLALGLQLGALVLGLALLLARAYIAPFTVVPDTAVAQGALPAIPGATEVTVTAKDIHFSVSEITLPSTEVNLTLRNDGVLPHDLSIPALGVHIAADSGESITTGLRDLPKGRYSGYCSVSGHADAGMEIVVIVD